MKKLFVRLSLPLLILALAGCGAIPVRNATVLSSRTLPATASVAGLPGAAPSRSQQDNTAAAAAEGEMRRAEGLRLARVLRDQGSFQAASEVYSQLDHKQLLKPLELLEYASTAAIVQTSQDSLALFGRARRELQRSAELLSPAAQIALCGGLGRARLALGQTEEALRDFDCVLQQDADNLPALNARGVALDALGRHEDARSMFARASALDPADFRVLNNLALSHLSSGNSAEGIRLLKQAGATGLPTARLNLALAYLLDGQDQEARQALGFLSPRMADKALVTLQSYRTRIRDGAPVAAEFLAASRQLLALREEYKP
ncbi:tetratricopeptide repeat protein [Uliginosibacterium sediminicola]|uniref:Tetratricopeptide repeat protein n=1 Tax=Uliginosibacterium sediminicola TaxID=2024550 RepID=A0ABU9YYX4_9RHOO